MTELLWTFAVWIFATVGFVFCAMTAWDFIDHRRARRKDASLKGGGGL